MSPTGPAALVTAARAAGVRDTRVLDAFAAVDRAGFLPPQHVALAYFDRPVPVAHAQVTTQPSLVARMIEALGLVGMEKVLEIGTGLGFQTALLARLAARVWSVERFADLAKQARANLNAAAVANVEVIVADGSEGLLAHAPYDAILVSAAYPSVPPPLIDQLAEGGRLVQPIGPGGADEVTAFAKQNGKLVRLSSVTDAYFVRLYGRHGYPGTGDG